MAASPYFRHLTHAVATPQTSPLPGREAEVTPNNAGGYGFILDDWERLHRFLILGSEGGTYYVGEQKLTQQNAEAAVRCIAADGVRAVNMAVEVNLSNLAPKTDQQLFVLALALKHGNEATKAAVVAAVPDVIRTGTQLLHFAAMLDSLGGWNRSKRAALKRWFTSRTPEQIAFQALKYQQRDGWAMRDVLRLAHPKPKTPEHNAVFGWIADRKDAWTGEVAISDDAGVVIVPRGAQMPAVLANHRRMKLMGDPAFQGTAQVWTPVERALFGIEMGLPREALPTEALGDLTVQRALLPQTPPHALLRNLGNWTASGLLLDPDAQREVAKKLTDPLTLRRARVHPFAILLASQVYQRGEGVRGGKTWVPQRAIIEALDDAYELAFEAVQPTGKRLLVAIDISQSMWQPCQGTPIPAMHAAAGMAITLARLEPHATVVQFDTQVTGQVAVTKRTSVSSLAVNSGGGTDLTAPIRWALAQPGPAFDAFILLTDNETWAGRQWAHQALIGYRQARNRAARLVSASMAANHANIVDPNDPLQLGLAGLDANLPALVSQFVQGGERG